MDGSVVESRGDVERTHVACVHRLGFAPHAERC